MNSPNERPLAGRRNRSRRFSKNAGAIPAPTPVDQTIDVEAVFARLKNSKPQASSATEPTLGEIVQSALAKSSESRASGSLSLARSQLVRVLAARSGQRAVAGLPDTCDYAFDDDMSDPLDRLAGADEVVRFGRALSRSLAKIEARELPPGALPKGLLISGPAGAGKTFVARALAQHTSLPVVFSSATKWLADGLGNPFVTLECMKLSFEGLARPGAGRVLIIDNLDLMPSADWASNVDWPWRLVRSYLRDQLCGAERGAGLFVVATAESPERVDASLFSGGAFDRHIRLGRLTEADIVRIACHHIEDSPHDYADLRCFAQAAANCTPAEIATIVQAAKRSACDRNNEDMHTKDLLGALRSRDFPFQPMLFDEVVS